MKDRYKSCPSVGGRTQHIVDMPIDLPTACPEPIPWPKDRDGNNVRLEIDVPMRDFRELFPRSTAKIRLPAGCAKLAVWRKEPHGHKESRDGPLKNACGARMVARLAELALAAIDEEPSVPWAVEQVDGQTDRVIIIRTRPQLEALGKHILRVLEEAGRTIYPTIKPTSPNLTAATMARSLIFIATRILGLHPLAVGGQASNLEITCYQETTKGRAHEWLMGLDADGTKFFLDEAKGDVVSARVEAQAAQQTADETKQQLSAHASAANARMDDFEGRLEGLEKNRSASSETGASSSGVCSAEGASETEPALESEGASEMRCEEADPENGEWEDGDSWGGGSPEPEALETEAVLADASERTDAAEGAQTTNEAEAAVPEAPEEAAEIEAAETEAAETEATETEPPSSLGGDDLRKRLAEAEDAKAMMVGVVQSLTADLMKEKAKAAEVTAELEKANKDRAASEAALKTELEKVKEEWAASEAALKTSHAAELVKVREQWAASEAALTAEREKLQDAVEMRNKLIAIKDIMFANSGLTPTPRPLSPRSAIASNPGGQPPDENSAPSEGRGNTPLNLPPVSPAGMTPQPIPR